MPIPNTESVLLDVVTRLARIEVKIDNSNEKLKEHDVRIAANSADIDILQSELVAYKARVATVSKLAACGAAAVAACAWLIDNASTLAAMAVVASR